MQAPSRGKLGNGRSKVKKHTPHTCIYSIYNMTYKCVRRVPSFIKYHEYSRAVGSFLQVIWTWGEVEIDAFHVDLHDCGQDACCHDCGQFIRALCAEEGCLDCGTVASAESFDVPQVSAADCSRTKSRDAEKRFCSCR